MTTTITIMELSQLVLALEALNIDVLVDGSLVSCQIPLAGTPRLVSLVSEIYPPAIDGAYRINFGYETLTFTFIG